MQEEFRESKNCTVFMCFVDMEKAFDRALRKVMEWAFKKERIGRSVGASSDEFIRGFKDES